MTVTSCLFFASVARNAANYVDNKWNKCVKMRLAKNDCRNSLEAQPQKLLTPIWLPLINTLYIHIYQFDFLLDFAESPRERNWRRRYWWRWQRRRQRRRGWRCGCSRWHTTGTCVACASWWLYGCTATTTPPAAAAGGAQSERTLATQWGTAHRGRG